MLYRVKIGEDEYIGTADEVVQFMARNEGAPGHDIASYMRGVIRRLEKELEVKGISDEDPVAFLLTLQEKGILPIEELEEPSAERVDPEEALGDGPVGIGEGVDPEDLDL
jgi:hypothetical protein